MVLFLLAIPLLATSCASSSAAKADGACVCECPCADGPEQTLAEGDSGVPETIPAWLEQTERQSETKNHIPIAGSPTLGPENAPITIVEFFDLQCPFCKRGAENMETLRELYPDRVRVVFKHYPLPFHKQADEAAKLSMAARHLGGDDAFWKMQRLFFDNQTQMKNKTEDDMLAWSKGFAEQIGLDPAQFESTYLKYEGRYQELLQREIDLAKDLDVRGIPQFFVNGARVEGAKPVWVFEAIINQQLPDAKELVALGVDGDRLYDRMVLIHFGTKPKPEKPRKPPPKVSYVPVEDDDPVYGNEDDALVTLVAFSDFQCPFCAKVVPAIDRVKEEYGDQVRVVFKQLPLPLHQQAGMAAEISLAANEQGKFWEMHDLLFEKQGEMKGKSDDEMIVWGVGLADQLDLDTDTFEEALESDKYAGEVAEEVRLARKVGARGTPNFWINGVNVVGAQPYAKFEEIIDEQLAVARETKKNKKLSGDALYRELVQINQGDAEPEPLELEPAPKVDLSMVTLEDAPARGPSDAKVTVVMFSDFQCPYCKRGLANLEDAMSKFDGEVRLVFKHFPLPFHQHARAAARAALAAGEQGKFWEMHDLLFERQTQLGKRGIYAELAEKLGLDVEQFEADMKKAEYKKIIDEDIAQGKDLGVLGTPAFFINGRSVDGAQPTRHFELRIRNALDD